MLTSRQVSVGTTAVDLLDGIDVDRKIEVIIRYANYSGNYVFLGDSGVTISNGFLLPNSQDPSGDDPQPIGLRLQLHGDTVYGVSSGSVTVHVLIVGVK